MNNNTKIENYKKRKVLLVLIIIFGLLTLGFSIFSLITKFTFLPALGCFVVEFILSKVRDRIKLKEEDPDSKN